MGGEGLAAHALAGVDEAVAAAVDVGVVDLGGVADEDEFAASGHAGDDGFCFEWGKLLCFVEDEEAVWDAASADVAEGFDFDDAALDEGVVRGAGGLYGGVVFGARRVFW